MKKVIIAIAIVAVILTAGSGMLYAQDTNNPYSGRGYKTNYQCPRTGAGYNTGYQRGSSRQGYNRDDRGRQGNNQDRGYRYDKNTRKCTGWRALVPNPNPQRVKPGRPS